MPTLQKPQSVAAPKPVSLLAGKRTPMGTVAGWFGKGLGILSLPLQLMRHPLLMIPIGLLNTAARSSNAEDGGFAGKALKVMQWPMAQLNRPLGDVFGENGIKIAAEPLAKVQQGINRITGNGKTVAAADAFINETHSTLRAKLPEIGDTLDHLRDAGQHIGTNVEAYNTSITAADKAFSNAYQAPEATGFFSQMWVDIKGFVTGGSKEQKAAAKMQRALAQKEQAVENEAFKTDPNGVTARRLSQMTVGQAVSNTVRYGSMALSTYHGLSNASDKIICMKHLMADVTGQDVRNISTWRVMTSSNVPPIIKNARKAFYHGVLPNFALMFGGFFLQEKLYKTMHQRGSSEMMATTVAMAASQGTTFLGNFFEKKSSLLDQYHALHLMQHAGERVLQGRDPRLDNIPRNPMQPEIPDQPNYSGLMLAAIPALEKKGGKYYKPVQTTALYCEWKQTPVAEVMKVLAGGEKAVEVFAAKAEKEITEARQRAKEQQDVAETDKAQGPGAGTSIVSRMRNERRELKGDGKFTAKVANEPERQLAK